MWVLDVIGFAFLVLGAFALAALGVQWFRERKNAVRRTVDAFARARQGWWSR